MKKTVILTIIFIFLTSVKVFAGVDISAECAVLIDAATGRVILERNSNMTHSMASTTKIMTAITALENSSPDDVVTMTKTSVAEEGSSVYLQEGDQMTMRDMLYGVMLNSGNDGATAVAEHISGSKEAFAELMNKKAAELGLSNTQFKNPNGLDDEGHYTTAYDLAMLTRYALKNKDFADIVKTYDKKAVILNRPEAEHYFVNHNKLLKTYQGCIGVKTGYTQKTGRCLVSAAERYGMTFIAVTLNAPDDWNDHAKMLDYGFNNYVARNVVTDGQKISSANVSGVQCDLIVSGEVKIPVNVNESEVPTVTELHCSNLQAPLNEGEKVGYVSVIYDGEEIGRADVVAGCDVYATYKENAQKRQTLLYTWFKRVNNMFFKF